MILVDTSVWVNHLRTGNASLAQLLDGGEVASHPFVVGEVACGMLRNRREVLALLASLPQVPLVEHGEALHFIDRHRLAGSGIGLIDVHLLAAAALGRVPIWTSDRALGRCARRLGLEHR